MVNCKFDSQTKERITNTIAEVSAHLNGIDFDKISRQILNTPEIIDPMIAAILFKQELADKKLMDSKKKQLSKVRIVDHIVATDPNPENRMLLICEGDSAIGSLIEVRNPKTTGGYPIRGKLKNVRDMKPVDIMHNVEIAELLSVIGLELGKPAIDLNYGKICTFSDMDLDGEHIFALLLNLYSLWPELFEQRRIYRMLSPLYYCTKGKDVKIFYTKEEFDEANTKGWEVKYFKGLGSMPLEVYSECVNNPRLELVIADDFEKLEMAFGSDADKRKKWMTG
jgi:DNA topoisomerase-2